MNIINIDNIPYRYVFFWKNNINDTVLDSDNKPLLYPSHNENIWTDKDSFLNELQLMQNNLYQNKKWIPYDKKSYKDCLLCDKKNITTGLYDINNIRWEDGLSHYIQKHNIKPPNGFIDFTYRYVNNMRNNKKNSSKVIGRLNGKKIVKSNKRYLKIDRKQILIMDALLVHGAKKIYKDNSDNNKDIYRYSEHSGLLDFDNTGLEKIIISGKTNRVDPHDNEIFLPKNMIDALDYEYIFHTHPPTPKPGGRVNLGILYEFPSISDVFHFIDHYNDGETQGSIVVAAEGMYIIRKKITDNNLIDIDENKFYNEISKVIRKCQRDAIEKYGTRFSTKEFYSIIAQDKTYINLINKVLNKYGLHIDFHPRIKDINNRWIIDTIYLPVYSIEFQ